jgi:aspartate racemase
MKTIGMLGGMSWESTASYYRAINQGIKSQLGDLHSAKICMRSVDFNELEQLQHQGNWEEIASILANEAHLIERGGADFLIMCTNTMHKVAPQIEAAISIPMLHIADATAAKLTLDNIKTVGLIGTKFTMTEEFFSSRLQTEFGIDVIVPNQEQQDLLHRVIYEELCLGRINDDSRTRYLEIITQLYEQGAEAVVLGCTEIALLVHPDQTHVPLYDTTILHASEAVRTALAK